MIKTMLVEDEKILLEDFLTIIDWKAEGFEIVATANNGKQGLNKFEQFHPDLIISDIKMPIMDGLTMLKSIKHTHPKVRFFLLSAYNEFEYVKDALRMGADDYILKSEISREYLGEKLRMIRDIMERENDLLSAAVEKKLLDFTADPQTADADTLKKILNPLKGTQESAAIAQILNFLLPAIQKHYQKMKISDRYIVPDISSFQELEEWLLNTLYDITRFDELIYSRQYSPVIINAIEYIRKNYGDPGLKITVIADHIGLSSGRLSVLFKQEMNQTVNDFITLTRIEEAKNLLSSGKYKVYEVSEMVGYKTSQYFSQIFFQLTAQYPNQYRRGVEHE